jgi:hypothetical protein
MTLFFIFKAHYIKRDKECGTFAFILAFSRHGKKIEREGGVSHFHLHLVLLGSMRVYPENTGNSEK